MIQIDFDTLDLIKNSIRKTVAKFGYEITKKNQSKPSISLKSKRSLNGVSDGDLELISSILPYTMTSRERIYALIESVNYVTKNEIPGSIVECGVWKGGSIMAAAKVLLRLNSMERDLYLFDTFEGMPKPTDMDVQIQTNEKAIEKFERLKISDNSSHWTEVSLEEVKNNISSIGYDKKKIHFIKGKVEETLPKNNPEKISILRLDTDWYASTLHELNHLFPLLSVGGVLIIDDYDWWQGQRKAIDEYFSKNKIKILLNKIDQSARIGVKI